MRLRNVKGSREMIGSSEFVVQGPEKWKGKWEEFFGNKHPVYIEIGMGKGQFIMGQALAHPEINFLGIEKYSSVLVRATEKRMQHELSNLFFIRMDAEEIENVFQKGEVRNIYLNFSDPWPKDRHAKRRLTSRQFLKRYDNILIQEGNVEFKTDNRVLFDFSLQEADLAGWTLKDSTYDLHHNEILMKGNIMTEYEERFSAAGNPIHKMIIFHCK